MSLLNIKRDIKDLRRLDEIILVFFEEGFGFFLDKINLLHRVPAIKKFKLSFKKKPELSIPERLKNALERLGPTFVKLGQILSVRPDLVPHEFIAELEKLQDEVPPFPYELAKKIVETELQKPLKTVFKSFEKKPIASASIAQVHKAVLKNGQQVAVKVQREGVKEKIDRDLDILFLLAHAIEKNFPETRNYRPLDIMKEFASWTRKELDFTVEGKNADIIRKNCKKDKDVKIPEIHWKFTTKKVLTLEFIDGLKFNDIEGVTKAKLNRRKLAVTGFNTFMKQALIDGFFHADPHPGNILCLKHNMIAYLDFGIVGRFNAELRDGVAGCFENVIKRKADKVTDLFVGFSAVPDYADVEGFRYEVREIVDGLYDSTLKEKSIVKSIYKVITSAARHGIIIPPDISLFGKALLTAEGVGYLMYPDFNLTQDAQPFMEKLLVERYSLKNVSSKVLKKIGEYKDFYEELPDHVQKIMKKLETGNIEFSLDKREVKEFAKHLDKGTDEKTIGLIIAALIIASAIIFYAEGRTQILGMSIGMIMLLAAALLTLWMTYLIIKK